MKSHNHVCGIDIGNFQNTVHRNMHNSHKCFHPCSVGSIQNSQLQPRIGHPRRIIRPMTPSLLKTRDHMDLLCCCLTSGGFPLCYHGCWRAHRQSSIHIIVQPKYPNGQLQMSCHLRIYPTIAACYLSGYERISWLKVSSDKIRLTFSSSLKDTHIQSKKLSTIKSGIHQRYHSSQIWDSRRHVYSFPIRPDITLW